MHLMPFDPKFVEAKLALSMIAPEDMPAVAWDALEAGLDGPVIRRLAALNEPSGWEVDQIVPAFMAEAGLKSLSVEEASVRVARQLARRIISEGLDPLDYLGHFEGLWIRAQYPREITEAGCLDDDRAWMGKTDAEFREYARETLLNLLANTDSASQG